MPDQRSDRRDAVELKTKSVSQIHIDPGNYSQVLVTVCGIPNSAELGVRIQNSAEFTDPEVILWNPDAARAESADRGSF